jgi:hypothetical protein
MRRPAKLVIRGIVAGIALASLGFMVASPASAHTKNIYGFVNYDGPSGFATFDRTNADATLLPALLSTGGAEVLGIDITNEVASGVGVTHSESHTYYTFTWDHTTGAFLSSVGAYIAGAISLDNMRGLDTLPDGTLVTWVDYTLDNGKGSASYSAIATVNSTTGELTPVIDMSDLLQGDPPGNCHRPDLWRNLRVASRDFIQCACVRSVEFQPQLSLGAHHVRGHRIRERRLPWRRLRC